MPLRRGADFTQGLKFRAMRRLPTVVVMAPSRPNAPPRYVLAASLAAAWALVFAALSFYWAAGGGIALKTIARDPDAVGWAGDPAVVAATGVLKMAAGVVALALAWRSDGSKPRRGLVAGTLAAGVLLALYGVASLVDHVLMLTGVRDIPELLGERAAWWHALLWDPWWILGGALFLAAARPARRTAVTGRPRSTSPAPPP